MICAPKPPPACGANCAAGTSEEARRTDPDKKLIQSFIRGHINEARACYEPILLTQPSARGRVRVRFGISPLGAVETSCVVSSDLGAPSVDACLLDRVLTWRLPKPQGGGWVIVDYPFSFVPATD